MKNRDLFDYRKELNNVDYLKGKKFAFAVFKNKQLLDSELEAINSVKKIPNDEYTKFEQERTDLCVKHSEKDDNGAPKFNKGQNGEQSFQIKEMELFQTDYTVLSEKYKTTLEEVEENRKEFEEFLDNEAEVEFKKVDIDDLPDDISASFLDSISFMIK